MCLLSSPSESIINTRTCCGVNEVSRVNRSVVSTSAPTPRSTSGGVQTPPSKTRVIAPRIISMPSVLGMKPNAPKSMQRRITAGSSLADTTTIGTLGYWARRYMRPETPRTPGMAKSSRMRSTSAPRSSSFVTSSKEPASAISTSSNRPETASRKAPRNSGWSSAMTMRIDSAIRFILCATLRLFGSSPGRKHSTKPHGPSGRCAGHPDLLQKDTIQSQPAADELQHDFASARLHPMLGNIDAFPRYERMRPAYHRNVERHAGEHGLHVRRHVVGPFGIMNPAGRRGCKAIEPTCKIAAHVRIGILLNHQRSRRMPREEEQCTIFRPALGNEPHNFARNLGEGASTGVDHKCRSRNELGHAVGDWRQRTLHDLVRH